MVILLRNLSHDYGIPEQLTIDGAFAQVGQNTSFMKTIRRYQIDHNLSGPRRPNEKPAESTIREKKVAKRLWEYGFKLKLNCDGMEGAPESPHENSTVDGSCPCHSQVQNFEKFA